MRALRAFFVLTASLLALSFSARAQDSTRMERLLGVSGRHGPTLFRFNGVPDRLLVVESSGEAWTCQRRCPHWAPDPPDLFDSGYRTNGDCFTMSCTRHDYAWTFEDLQGRRVGRVGDDFYE